MKCLLIGAAGQGKLAYAREYFALETVDIGLCNRENHAMQVLDKTAVYNLQELVWALLKQGIDPQDAILKRLDTRTDWIILCDEVGCGVVPMDAFTRTWRECVGRICCALAQRADRVERVFCGLTQTIKP